jgi:hypothetical protein
MLRFVFWLTLVIAFIPVNPADLRDGQRPVSAYETVRIAHAAYADLSQFCVRNAEACATTRQIAGQFGLKARAGFDFLSGAYRLAAGEKEEIDKGRTGAIGK